MRKIIALMFIILFIGCSVNEDKPYSEELQRRIAQAGEINQTRPDYLPLEMYAELPEFPNDFYGVRTLVRSGQIKDFGELGEEYWMQPEFFPNFEDIGLSKIQNPPENRWGAQGYLVYPADTLAVINPGDTLDMYFFVKSSYLVETYQGIYFEPEYPNEASIITGATLPDGANKVVQDAQKVKDMFEVKIAPNPFLLEPNFPIFKRGGTARVKVSITAGNDVPTGNYVIGLDTKEVPEEYEKQMRRNYLNRYVSGSMTKIHRPYHYIFIRVPGGETQ